MSGGVDSVVAALINKAIGNQLTCIFVDHGFLRKDEEKEVVHNFKKYTNAKIVHIKAKYIYAEIKNIKDPERKRKIIGRVHKNIWKRSKKIKNVKFLAQGTLYPDVIESKNTGIKVKSYKIYHNVDYLKS